jgi:hypothetical protein
MLTDGDRIEYVRDVIGPPQQAGTKGERRTVGVTIEVYPANYLLTGGYIRKVEAPAAKPCAAAPKRRTYAKRKQKKRKKRRARKEQTDDTGTNSRRDKEANYGKESPARRAGRGREGIRD